MPPSKDSQRKLLEHSEAKVRLLAVYLRSYLSILTNSKFVNSVDVYDLFCGRGVYENHGEGSPLVILREINGIIEGRLAKGQRLPMINCHFFDEEHEHIESVSGAIADRHLHKSDFVNLEIERKKYEDSLGSILKRGRSPQKKLFTFIDPYGYSDVRVNDIGGLLNIGGEVLLFLPAQFLYRFENFPPGALKQLITDVSQGERWHPTKNVGEFVFQLRNRFREYFGNGTFVSNFLIEKDPQTVFCLFFFTRHALGHAKMVDAKWKIDDDAGRGWSFRKIPRQENLIPGLETLELEEEIYNFIRDKPRNNCEMYDFVVNVNEHPQSHAKKVCKSLIAKGKINVEGLGSPLPNRDAFYITYESY
jgi:three-Cys-motif partner protein